jgi:hypothetical protein
MANIIGDHQEHQEEQCSTESDKVFKFHTIQPKLVALYLATR